MRKIDYNILGIVLFGSTLMVTPQVSAEEIPKLANATEVNLSSQNSSDYTDHEVLNRTISDASAAGITVIETVVQDVESQETAQSNYQEQALTIQEAIKQYSKAKEDYR